MIFKKVTHVIFDMDGLLLGNKELMEKLQKIPQEISCHLWANGKRVKRHYESGKFLNVRPDSETGYDKIMENIAHRYGKEYSIETKLKILGTPESDTAEIAIKELELPISTSEFLEIYRKLIETELQNPALMPGAERLVRHLHKHNIPIALATSSSDKGVEIKTKNHRELFDLFHHKVMGSSDPEVKHGKPSPDIFLVCASRFPDKPNPDKCLVLEDAPNGIKGAIATGMQAVMVPTKEVNQELRKSATLVLDSLEDFQPELFGLPPFNDCK